MLRVAVIRTRELLQSNLFFSSSFLSAEVERARAEKKPYLPRSSSRRQAQIAQATTGEQSQR